MIKRLRNRQAQANITEYVIVVFVVVAMMTAMGTYVKRALQGRIFDARGYAVDTIKDRTRGAYDGNVYYEYEPYYSETVTTIQTKDMTIDRLFTGGASSREFNSETIFMTNSETAPPMDAD